MKKILLVLLIAFPFGTLQSQTSAYLETNNIKARINTNGTLFMPDFEEESNTPIPTLEAPKGSGTNSMLSAAFWMGGLDISQTLRIAKNTYGQVNVADGSENDYSYGPIANDYSSDPYIQRYEKVWSITREQIENHIAHYSNSGYSIPDAIYFWPGNGNTENGEAAHLAPYVDVNSNGYYDPQNGDYPEIRGDQAVFFILNDSKSTPTTTRIGVEIHGMAYVYDAPTQPELNETAFINLKIYNRGGNYLRSFYFGIYNDFDLGFPHDDYIGSDSLLNMTYVYNGDTLDESSSYGLGYETQLPAQGCMFLNSPMAKSVYYNYSNSVVDGVPIQPHHYYNFMRGIWKNGSPITYGDDGTNTSSFPANYMFSGKPENDEGWTEESVDHMPADRRILMSTGPFNFFPGDVLCFDIAYPFAPGVEGESATASLITLRERAALIQAFYDNQNFDCAASVLSVAGNEAGIGHFNIFPNPSKGIVTLKSEKNMKSIAVFNSLGQQIFSTELNSTTAQINLEKYPAGVYLYRITSADGYSGTGKIILE